MAANSISTTRRRIRATSSHFSKLLTTPSKIASTFDWKRQAGANNKNNNNNTHLLSLSIHKNSIGMALSPSSSSKNSSSDGGPNSLGSLYMVDRRKMDTRTKQAIAKVIQQNDVCGMVVSWPTQQESGRNGEACGRVLFTLEQLLNDGSTTQVPKRPLCLWNSSSHSTTVAKANEHQEQQHETTDPWGRSSQYAGHAPSSASTTTTRRTTMEYRSRSDQYDCVTYLSPVEILEDFWQVHFPQEQSASLAAAATTTTTRRTSCSSRYQNPQVLGRARQTTNHQHTTNSRWTAAPPSTKRKHLVAA